MNQRTHLVTLCTAVARTHFASRLFIVEKKTQGIEICIIITGIEICIIITGIDICIIITGIERMNDGEVGFTEQKTASRKKTPRDQRLRFYLLRPALPYDIYALD